MTSAPVPAASVPLAGGREPYRLEIEGLRAVAVLAVLLFHAGLPLSGGYIGVDVFFVISGFLITGNILRALEAGRFTFRRFYIRRIRRLFPALAATLLVTLAAGRQWFAPDDMARLAKSALFAVMSISNVLFWRDIGYFDAEATSKPLLHTWSLGVEEQFYLLWPAVVVAASALRVAWGLAALIAVVGISSFAGAELYRTSDPGGVFYLMPFRMFELSSGALLAAIDPRQPRSALATLATVAGLCTIAYCIVRFDAATAGEHYWAVLPCLGTVLVIYGGLNSWSAPLLANRVATGIGAISYSLYLVHWPIVAFYHYVQGPELSLFVTLQIVGAALVLAAAMNWLVERPLRTGGRAGRSLVGTRTALAAITTLGLLVSVIAVDAWHTGGWPARLPQELGHLPSEAAMWNERNPHARVGTCFVYAPAETTFDEAGCLRHVPGKPNYLIVGDSFAADAYVYLSAAFPDVNFLQATAGGCHPVIGNQSGDALCKALLGRVFDTYIPGSAIDGVILGAAWDPGDPDLLEPTIQRLASLPIRVLLLGSGIRFDANLQPLIYQSERVTVRDVERFVNSRIPPWVITLNRTMRERFGGEVDAYIDVQSIMCEGHCGLFTPAGQLIYIDFGHMTLAGSRYLAPKIASRYPNLFVASSRGRAAGGQ